ncbi:hypothetical protein CH253_08210 [Rhodococcus sp. 06-156-3C]|uniref:hypothetical protein n=1 Tax=Rhodococcus sp. 06-156-3C TaxID=2022486 RepID=UPI000B9C4A2E|nr:hypothetical protein [Rhodococcus sp. 06-156-3C]OZD23836.1 hypothetical protein CH253_08210 [Rhodococcus sp. 06-156-3C]
MSQRYVVKKGRVWNVYPQANWFMRYFGFAQVKRKDGALTFPIRFATHAEAVDWVHRAARGDFTVIL